jgi:hypothetical protein
MQPFDPRLTIIAAEAKVKTCHVFHCWQAMREMGQAFHVPAFAHFAGLSETHVNAILAALDAHKALPGPKRAAIERGTRLPLDWRLPDDWKAYAIEQRKWEPEEVEKEAASFADYWQAKAGQGAIKLDWRKTWLNWVRNSNRADGTFVSVEGRQHTPVEWRDFCKERVDKASSMGWAQGLEEWTLKLREAENKLSSNVVPISRAI